MRRRPILLIALLYFFHNSFSQEGVTITAYTDKSRIVLGERLKLTVEVFIPGGMVPEFPLTDTIDHFEFLSAPSLDTVKLDGGTAITGIYTLTSFDSGHWVIPSFVFSENILSDTIPIDVGFSPFDAAQEYHDIKEIIEVKPAEKENNWWYYIAAGLFAALLVLAWLFRRKKKPVIEKPQVITDPYADAMKDLDTLGSSGVDPREFHSRLSDIFRLYIYRKEGILSLQKTTDDLVMRLADLELPKTSFDSLSQALRLGDFVKFAKFTPTREDDIQAYEVIRKNITMINQLPKAEGPTS